MSEAFDRNIRISLMVIGGEFEAALEDIIVQLESPPQQDGRTLTAWEMTQLIAEAMSEGFAGLPPNGFDFACWLWETAPIHIVSIPHANSIGTSHGYRYGVVHLRKIAAMIAGSFVAQQPQKAQSVVELIDMSVDWIDARNLINYSLVDFHETHFASERAGLEAMADSPKPWRRLIPLGVAARLLGTRSPDSPAVYGILQRSFANADDPHVYHALRYVLRIAGMYGDQHELLGFLTSMQRDGNVNVASLVCEFLRNPRLPWEGMSREEVLRVLKQWRQDESIPSASLCLDQTIARLQAAGH
jgi:hypothetical protein